MSSASAGIPPRSRRFDLTPWVLVTPAAVIFLGLYVIPMAILFAQSFWSVSYASPDPNAPNSFTLDNYIKFVTDPYYPKVLLNTLRLAFLCVVLCVALGFPYAYLLQLSSGRLRTLLLYTLLAPLLINSVVRSFGWVALLSTDGVVNSALQALRLTDGPIKLLYTDSAVILGLVHTLLVFMVIPISESLRTIDPQLKLAAATLGANPLHTLRRITVPLAAPGILAGSLIVFAITTSAFVAPRILGGSNVTVMGYVTIQENLVSLNWPFGAAIAFITLGASLLVILASQRVDRASQHVVVN